MEVFPSLDGVPLHSLSLSLSIILIRLKYYSKDSEFANHPLIHTTLIWHAEIIIRLLWGEVFVFPGTSAISAWPFYVVSFFSPCVYISNEFNLPKWLTDILENNQGRQTSLCTNAVSYVYRHDGPYRNVWTIPLSPLLLTPRTLY